NSANSRSNAATSGPCVTQPERIGRRAASTSRSSSQGRITGMNGCPIVASPINAISLWFPVAHHLALQKLLRRRVQTQIPVTQESQPLLKRDLGAKAQQLTSLARISIKP